VFAISEFVCVYVRCLPNHSASKHKEEIEFPSIKKNT